ncbi:AT-rich interactive domain-containing protein 2-like isoform X1 [Haliotis rufescens]|uniref:AT-rich interactive domain-containing protein 2-like isoform X1 n=1 Tax=Haliotis rufescens TaxID=6454 RepID=UPI00201FA4F0|nr:AT-rich interactive domain-containing protein 2-like isoform X1 [Haliotis rufescens]
MANLLNKDPFTYEEERRSFLHDLQGFHQNRGTPYDRIPQIGGREVDLYRLYRRVIELGGFQKVNNEEKWEDIQGEFKVPRSCTNGAQALKFVYVRYLHIYEKIHFLGQDPDRNDEDDGHPARKKLCTPTFGVPLTYNYHHHQPTDAVRQTYSLSQDLLKPSEYDKLERSLLSGLPNEVDFVVNVCTLLSNESRHVLTLKKSHQLVDLLLAHIGIFSEDTCCLEDLYKYGWTKHCKRDYLRFWYESVHEETVRELLLSNGAVYDRDKLCGSEILNIGRDLGIYDKEGQRITQLAVLFRNLSFEQANQEYLATHSVIFRFLMLCIHSSYGSLAQLALDTLGNVAGKLKLKAMAEIYSKALLDLITKGLHSEDKFFVVRALEILGKLCQLEENEVIVSDRLQSSTYEDVCRLLTIHDIQLIVHTLETLYQLSELGEQTTTRIAAVKSAVDLLIGLITVEAQSYGPNSLIGIKVVEYVPPPDTSNKVPSGECSSVSIVMQPPGTPVSKSTAVAHSTPPRPPPPPAELKHNNPCSDNESTTCNWLQATYETRRSGKVNQMDLLAEYLQFCRKYSVPEVLTSTDFMHLVKVVFPQAELTSKDKPNGEKEICFIGLSKRANPKPFAITHSVPKSRSVTVNSLHGSPTSANTSQVDLTQTPTLRQRLMEPPRIALHQQLVNAGTRTPGQKDAGKAQTPTSKSKSKAAMKTLTAAAGAQILEAPLPVGALPQPNLPTLKPKSVLQQQLQSPLSGKGIAPKPGEQAVLASGLVPGVAQAPQNFPTIHNALQADGKSVSNLNDLPLEVLQKSSDTNLIKSLLARKLSQNMVGRQPQPVPSQDPTSGSANPCVDLRGPSPLPTTDIGVGQPQQFDSPQSAPEVVTHHHEFVQHNNHNPTSPQPQPQPQPQPESPQPTSFHQVPLAPASPAAQQPSQSQKTPTTNSKTAKSKKGPGSPHPSSPKAKSQTSSSSSGSRPCSPRAASPRSQQAYELEVCGEVERAKDIVKSGAEAFIERVENRNLQQWQKVQKSLPKPSAILMPPENMDSQSAELNAVAVDQTEVNSNRVVANDIVSTSSNVVAPKDVSDSKPSQEDIHSKAEYVSNNQNIPSDNINSDTTTNSHTLATVGNHCSKEDVPKAISDSKAVCGVVKQTPAPQPVMNGGLSSPFIPDSDLPPSPVDTHKEALDQDKVFVNGVNDVKEEIINDSIQQTLTKDQLLKIVEKTGKLNGIVNHVGNGDHIRQEEDMEVGGNVGVQSKTGGGDEQRVPLPGEQVRLQAPGGQGDSISQGMNGNSAYIPVAGGATHIQTTVNENNVCVSVTVAKTELDSSSQTRSDQNSDIKKLCKQNHEKVEIPMEKLEQRICDTRHVPTPETSRDSELSSDSFASSTAESVGDKHSTINMTSGVVITTTTKDTALKAAAVPFTATSTAASINTKATGKPKPRKRSRSNASNTSTSSQESRSSVVMVPLNPEYMCEWNSCKKCFDSARSVFIHVSRTHIDADTDGICRWLGCEQLKRKRWSLVTHCQDHHCSEHALRAAHQRRITAAQTGQPSPAITTPTTMVYPNDAAMQAIKRFTPKPPFPEFSEPREGPVTKHIRLTAALILRNLARYSALGRSLIKRRERHLSYQTMSAVEASNALANCLWEILHDT